MRHGVGTTQTHCMHMANTKLTAIDTAIASLVVARNAISDYDELRDILRVISCGINDLWLEAADESSRQSSPVASPDREVLDATPVVSSPHKRVHEEVTVDTPAVNAGAGARQAQGKMHEPQGATKGAVYGKQCSRCGASKPLAAFSMNRAAKDGLCAACKDCQRRAVAARA